MKLNGGRTTPLNTLLDCALLVLAVATAADGRLPLCDTDEHLAILWPDCGSATQFCVCTTHDEWACLPCPRGQQFAFELQMCVPTGPATTTTRPEPDATTLAATTVAEQPDADDCSTGDLLPTAGTRLTTRFVLPTAAERWEIVRSTGAI